MNTIKNAERMEKLRKARSLNDVISIVRTIAKDVMASKKAIKKMEAKAAADGYIKLSALAANKGKAGEGIRFGGGMFEDDMPKQRSKEEIERDLVEKGLIDGEERKAARNARKVNMPRPNPLSSGIKVQFKKPSIDLAGKVVEKVDVLHDLHENMEELEAAKQKIIQQFSRMSAVKVAVRGIEALYAQVEKDYHHALDLLHSVSKKHLPKEFDAMNQVLIDYLVEQFPDDQHITREIYTTIKGVDDENESDGVVSKKPTKIKVDLAKVDFAFHCYITIHDLKNDAGWVFKEYCMILTGIVSRDSEEGFGKLRYFLTALPEFRTPGKFLIGQEVRSEEEMLQRAALLLAHNDLIVEMERKPMPLTNDDARKKGFHSIQDVDRVEIIDDTMRVIVAKGKDSRANVERIKGDVQALLHAVVNVGKKGGRAQVLQKENQEIFEVDVGKSTTKKDPRTVIEFSLIPTPPDTKERRDYSVNAGKLKEMQQILGLPDDVIKEVKQALLRRL